MHTFIHGWRRKAGVITLVMACAFATGWMRSYIKEDFVGLTFEYQWGKWSIDAIGTEDQSLVLYGISRANEPQPLLMEEPIWSPPPMVPLMNLLDEKVEPAGDFAEPERAYIEMALYGEFSHFEDIPHVALPPATKPIIRMRFDWIVAPLTLISAYLLLWKPRKRAE